MNEMESGVWVLPLKYMFMIDHYFIANVKLKQCWHNYLPWYNLLLFYEEVYYSCNLKYAFSWIIIREKKILVNSVVTRYLLNYSIDWILMLPLKP